MQISNQDIAAISHCNKIVYYFFMKFHSGANEFNSQMWITDMSNDNNI